MELDSVLLSSSSWAHFQKERKDSKKKRIDTFASLLAYYFKIQVKRCCLWSFQSHWNAFYRRPGWLWSQSIIISVYLFSVITSLDQWSHYHSIERAQAKSWWALNCTCLRKLSYTFPSLKEPAKFPSMCSLPSNHSILESRFTSETYPVVHACRNSSVIVEKPPLFH